MHTSCRYGRRGTCCSSWSNDYNHNATSHYQHYHHNNDPADNNHHHHDNDHNPADYDNDYNNHNNPSESASERRQPDAREYLHSSVSRSEFYRRIFRSQRLSEYDGCQLISFGKHA